MVLTPDFPVLHLASSPPVLPAPALPVAHPQPLFPILPPRCHAFSLVLAITQGQEPMDVRGHDLASLPRCLLAAASGLTSSPFGAGLFFEARQGHRLLLPISSKGQLRPSRNSSSASFPSASENIVPSRRAASLQTYCRLSGSLRDATLEGEHWGGAGSWGWGDAPWPGQLPLLAVSPRLFLLHFWLQKPFPQQHLPAGADFCLNKAGDEVWLLLQCRLVVYVLLGLGSLLLGGLSLPCPPTCQCYDTSKVFCSEERMREIPAGLPGNATQLFFVETALSSVRSGALGSSTTLTKLVFLNNNIQELEAGAFRGLSSLAELEVSGNPLPAVSPRVLVGLPSLTKLSLGANAIRSLQPGLFTATCHLQDLRLPGNKIEVLPPSIFNPLRHLQTLDLSQNVLAELPAGLLDPLTALRLLKLSDNLLAWVPPGAFGALGQLAELHLDGNRLEELPAGAFVGLGGLRRLQLQHNTLGSLAPDIFAHLPNLTVLSLEGNRLATLPTTLFTSTPCLLHLSLARNQLEMLPQGLFTNLSALQTLMLSHNAMVHLPAGVFQGLAGLAVLQLSHNNLSSLPAGLLAELPLLTALALDYNRLPRLPLGLFDANELLAHLELANNPWACDCRLGYLLGWLQDFAEPLTHAQASCASPAALRGRSLLEVPQGQLECSGAPGMPREEGWDGELGEDAPGQCTYSNPEGTISVACDARSCQQLSLRLPPPPPSPPGQVARPGPAYQGAWVLHSRCGTLQVSVLITAQSGDEATSPSLPAVP
ncbi:carboxypeptidase N subunit 2 [Podargus strigoides]